MNARMWLLTDNKYSSHLLQPSPLTCANGHEMAPLKQLTKKLKVPMTPVEDLWEATPVTDDGL
jgi:hypothetical protein